MMLLRPPGVYRPQSDTHLLTRALRRADVPPGARLLELGTGTGAVAVAAARVGCEVVAVDVSARAVLAARLNARVRGLPVRVLHGDLFAPVAGEVFDVIVANPPYVPGDTDPASARGRARTWEAGPTGRAVLDKICQAAPRHLSPSGTLLVVHSALSGVAATLVALRRAGMRAQVVARQREPFGPVMRGRAEALAARRLLRPGQRHEDLVVVRADRITTRQTP
ncbi:methyltransferase domain-containing protein [Actinomadura sp. KC06]|uniref:HemK2/MTQ2 family protein methyltransferase n=1 Tax=Actinomadura sp. KC06 TaxID=2530369 RepID=UPI00104DAA64|nr:HemK2/MTQ2 family protein methyltransferase [Actinomadura sp. KC06]TDD34085.1 methyltransferase domain-containing protein [Actinomadura sp. KC06]